MAIRCEAKLKPFNETIEHATDYRLKFLAWRAKRLNSATIPALVDEYLEAKRSNVRKPLSLHTINELKQKGHKLIEAFGKAHILEIEQPAIEAYLDRQKISNQTRKNILVKWGQFFNWAISKGYTDNNPCNNVEVFPSGREIKRYNAAIIREMFAICEAEFPDLLPYLAVCTFAGLRPSECERLTWNEILLDTNPPQIEVIKSTFAVKDFTRHVTIQPNLLEWLKVCPHHDDSIIQPNFRKRFDAFKIKCGFKLRGENPTHPAFIPDGLRHTFASFWRAKYKNDHYLAAEMGNSVDMIRNHYNKAVRANEVDAFWSTMPRALMKAQEREQALAAALSEMVDGEIGVVTEEERQRYNALTPFELRFIPENKRKPRRR